MKLQNPESGLMEPRYSFIFYSFILNRTDSNKNTIELF
jgi:hypothetical protein